MLRCRQSDCRLAELALQLYASKDMDRGGLGLRSTRAIFRTRHFSFMGFCPARVWPTSYGRIPYQFLCRRYGIQWRNVRLAKPSVYQATDFRATYLTSSTLVRRSTLSASHGAGITFSFSTSSVIPPASPITAITSARVHPVFDHI
jgi:hypothetical protein